MKRTHVKGFSIVEVGLVIAIIAIIGGLGVVFYNKWQASHQTQASKTSTPTAQTTTATPTITKTADLDKAASTLDSTDVTSSADDAALNSNLSF